MSDLTELEHAYSLLQAGRHQEAEATCRKALDREPLNAHLVHLLGLILSAAGDTDSGEQWLRASVGLQPRQADFHFNLAQLLHRLNRLPEAERCFREALSLQPGHRAARLALAQLLTDSNRHIEADKEYRAQLSHQSRDAVVWTMYAASLREQQRFGDAESAYRHAMESNPRFSAAHHNLGALLIGFGRAEEAHEALERARACGAKGFHVCFSQGRALLQLYRIDAAERAFSEAVALEPRSAEAQFILARVRRMLQDPHFARDIVSALSTYRDDPDLQMLLADVLWHAGDAEHSEQVLRALVERTGSPESRNALAAVLNDVGRLKEAEAQALEAAAARPNDPAIIETLVSILLSRGRPNEALAFIRTQRTRSPRDQGWIACEAIAARQLDQPLYGEWFDYDRLVRTYEIPAPSGWSSITELNTALLEILSQRHASIGTSFDPNLRNGSRTLRTLLTEPHPAIQAILKAFEDPVADYLHAIGTDPTHPLTAYNVGMASIVDAWSTQLQRNGVHLNHVHRAGWISSSYYVSVPEEAADPAAKAGWLKLGEPRNPTPKAQAAHFVAPRAGTLVLFPSYMWHGTNPTYGRQPRVSIAFDALPGRQGDGTRTLRSRPRSAL